MWNHRLIKESRGVRKSTEIAKAFLIRSFESVGFDYDLLTPQEQSICTKEEYWKLIKWVKGEDENG